jgi:hypothetical protein
VVGHFAIIFERKTFHSSWLLRVITLGALQEGSGSCGFFLDELGLLNLNVVLDEDENVTSKHMMGS